MTMTTEPADQPSGLPPAVELLWQRRDRPRRGPKPGLSLERIVAAAVEIADTDGLAALSMSRLATELGFSTMSLYRYVATKDDLFVLMLDAASPDPPDLLAAADVDGAGWRAGLELWSRANLDGLVRHPWMMEIAITGPPIAPKQVAWMEAALKVLARTPLSPAEQVGVLQLLLVHTLGEARLAVDLSAAVRAAAQTGGPTAASYGQLLRQLLDEQRHPAMSAIVAAGVFDAPTEYTDEDFAFGLGRVLDGIGLLIESRSR